MGSHYFTSLFYYAIIRIVINVKTLKQRVDPEGVSVGTHLNSTCKIRTNAILAIAENANYLKPNCSQLTSYRARMPSETHKIP